MSSMLGNLDLKSIAVLQIDKKCEQVVSAENVQ
jgi:hypothetical protein